MSTTPNVNGKAVTDKRIRSLPIGDQLRS